MRSLSWIVAASSWWVCLALLVLIAALLLAAAAWAEVGQALSGLAGLACAPCVDPSNGMSTAAAAAGTAAAGAAGGGAAAGTGRSSGRRDPRIPDPTDDVGDQTPWETLPSPLPFPSDPLSGLARQLQKWTEAVMGVDTVGTRGPSHERIGMEYDADYVGRDYEANPLEPPAPRDS